MADPISILGATASVVSIIDILVKSISTIHSLRAQWKDADLALLSLTSQLAALRTALAKIKEWMESAMGDLDYQLVMDLDGSIQCCSILASTINRELGKLVTTFTGQLAMSSKARFVFQSTEMTQLQNMIDRQTSVLTLLLTACNTNTLAEQHRIVSKSSARNSVKRVQADTASLIVHTDSASIFSSSTVNTSKLSVIFDFDSELFASKPYRGAIWKNMKLSIRSRKRREANTAGHSGAFSTILPLYSISTTDETIDTLFLDKQGPVKISLLGIRASSKSTFLKQLQHISGEQSWEKNPAEWRAIINEHLLWVFGNLLDVLVETSVDFWENERLLAFDPRGLLLRGVTESLPPGFPGLFRKLLTHTSVQDAIQTTDTSDFENLDYFVLHLDRLCGATSLLLYEDIIRVHFRTSGISESNLKITSQEYRIFDVGGSRPERTKWIHVFHDGSTILFFVPMSCYDQVLYEDRTTNEMQESLVLYDSVWKHRLLEQSRKILCFTKMDLFAKKISAGASILQHFPDYEGAPGDISAVQAFFTKKFVDLHTPDQMHYLDVTNMNDVRDVISKVFNCEVPYPQASATETDGI
ncbi:G-protein alpha subunit-domain-containing protein [Clohesyomyces aquaticus]|uniref:G-protein alpha subunit-domain-containing protein n=1 Tax=Clohesyomyces aquaticus TaxID=1231657 RepID=A0A1Y1YQ80_9PLEO|nr:G-protein alpha subunit-domain-containing protein [Clohesyomyces aquaticus]